ncbi:MAG: hypothetical protein JOZ28_09775 [Candidatus Eremiobacteraeota bacterium]|nr:hypothetical protein [Candidatus Eremiobacteraeota bacterium]
MRERNKRVLWLLNHKTLMPYEVGLLQDLGFEVFTPKVLPPTEEYRSCAVDFAPDARLTIPQRCLEQLNAFNFYTDTWSPQITALVNRYFGTAFVVVHRHLLSEVVDKFEGHIVLRAFGLPDATLSYVRAVEAMYGAKILSKIYALGNRFWFGQGYEQLQECEPALFAHRAVFLPFGLPASAGRNANHWNGSVKKILFMCRWVVTDPYYADVYERFKREFGDLPHLIVGSQDVAVEDASLMGYVSDKELQRLFQDCAVLYYHSREPRHVHYYPVEAATVGMPVVFYNDSLLGRLTKRPMAGGVDTAAQAREMVERILAGDRAVIDSVRRDQQHIVSFFSDVHCRSAWQRSIAGSDVFPRPATEPWAKVWAREGLRWLLMPLAKGRVRLPLRDDASLPPYAELQDPLRAGEAPDSMVDGIDFRNEQYPNFVCLVGGMSTRERWGRWSVGPKITFLLSQFLDRRFRLIVVGGAYGKNIGAPVWVRIGSVKRMMRFSTAQTEPKTVVLEFSLSTPSNVIEFMVPHPTHPGGDDSRAVGIALVAMRIEPIDT